MSSALTVKQEHLQKIYLKIILQIKKIEKKRKNAITTKKSQPSGTGSDLLQQPSQYTWLPQLMLSESTTTI